MLNVVKHLRQIRFRMSLYSACALIGVSVCVVLVVMTEMCVTMEGNEVASGIFEVGHITNPRIMESSGLVASRQHHGVFWTHNDGGGPKRQLLCGIDRAGKPLADFDVVGVEISDWEDIALDNAGHLYIGDIGNNDARREEISVYEIDEPDPESLRHAVSVNRTWKLRFPKQPFDCEALFVWESHAYIISKVFNNKNTEIFRFPLADTKDSVTLDRVAPLPVASPVTGADISSDGRRLGLVCHAGAFIFEINGKFGYADDAPYRRAKFRNNLIEGCCFVPEGLLATTESSKILLFSEAAFEQTR